MAKQPKIHEPEQQPVRAVRRSFYTVEHTQVGQWTRGTELSGADLDGIDVQRLLEIGAIAFHSEIVEQPAEAEESAEVEESAETGDAQPPEAPKE